MITAMRHWVISTTTRYFHPNHVQRTTAGRITENIVTRMSKRQHSDHASSSPSSDLPDDDVDDDHQRRRYISVCHERDPDTKMRLFRDQYDTISRMRYTEDGVAFNAPADIMSCSDVPAGNAPQSKSYRFQILVSLILSVQTKDVFRHDTLNRLVNVGLSPESLLDPEHELGNAGNVERLIQPVRFYKRKAQYLRRMARILKDSYDGDVPMTIRELCTLPGVGSKIAHAFVNVTAGESQGIGVDVHVHRVSNRVEWVDNTKTPEQTRKELETFVPRERWHGINKG